SESCNDARNLLCQPVMTHRRPVADSRRCDQVVGNDKWVNVYFAREFAGTGVKTIAQPHKPSAGNELVKQLAQMAFRDSQAIGYGTRLLGRENEVPLTFLLTKELQP